MEVIAQILIDQKKEEKKMWNPLKCSNHMEIIG